MNKIILIFVSVFLLVSCASKKEFEPKKVDRKLAYSKTVNSKLFDVARDGATYQNGKVITKKGILDIKIPKNFRFVNFCENLLIVTSNKGDMQIISKDKKVLFKKEFSSSLMSATLDKNLLALVLANNTIMLYDIKEDRLIYKEPLAKVAALDARLANPIFINDLVIFATLDGRLLFMNSAKKVILRDVAISNKSLFNNVIFLKVDDKGQNLLAATSSKAVLINPKSIFNKSIDIRDIIYENSNVYIFTKSGRIVLLDEKLEILKELKFPYAIFSSVFSNGKLYAVERTGYLIEIEKDLNSSRVSSLPEGIEGSVFCANKKIYVDTNIINIK